MLDQDAFYNSMHLESIFSRVNAVVLAIALHLFLKGKEARAKRGCEESGRAMILPIYRPLLYVIYAGLVFELLCLGLESVDKRFGFPVLLSYWWTRFGTSAMFFQASLSKQAFHRGLKWSLLAVVQGLLTTYYF